MNGWRCVSICCCLGRCRDDTKENPQQQEEEKPILTNNETVVEVDNPRKAKVEVKAVLAVDNSRANKETAQAEDVVLIAFVELGSNQCMTSPGKQVKLVLRNKQ